MGGGGVARRDQIRFGNDEKLPFWLIAFGHFSISSALFSILMNFQQNRCVCVVELIGPK